MSVGAKLGGKHELEGVVWGDVVGSFSLMFEGTVLPGVIVEHNSIHLVSHFVGRTEIDSPTDFSLVNGVMLFVVGVLPYILEDEVKEASRGLRGEHFVSGWRISQSVLIVEDLHAPSHAFHTVAVEDEVLHSTVDGFAEDQVIARATRSPAEDIFIEEHPWARLVGLDFG